MLKEARRTILPIFLSMCISPLTWAMKRLFPMSQLCSMWTPLIRPPPLALSLLTCLNPRVTTRHPTTTLWCLWIDDPKSMKTTSNWLRRWLRGRIWRLIRISGLIISSIRIITATIYLPYFIIKMIPVLLMGGLSRHRHPFLKTLSAMEEMPTDRQSTVHSSNKIVGF